MMKLVYLGTQSLRRNYGHLSIATVSGESKDRTLGELVSHRHLTDLAEYLRRHWSR